MFGHILESITASTASASTTDALNASSAAFGSAVVSLQAGLWHATDAGPGKVCLFGLDTSQTTQLLIALLFPLCDQVGIGIAVLQQPVVKRFGDCLALVVEVVDVAAAGVGDLEDWPKNFVFLLAVVGRILGVAHLVGIF